MSEIADNTPNPLFTDKRLLRIMTFVSFTAVIGSLYWGNWQITLGLWLGCFLSFVNFIWAKIALKALFEKNAKSVAPKFSVVRYFFRYIIFGLVIGFFYYFNIISVAAALIGLLTFIVSIFISALIQPFIVWFKREDI